MSHIFISYSRDDITFAERLEQALEGEGREVWRDKNKNQERSILPSADWQDDIRRALIAADTFLFIVSPSSVVSPNCAKEIEQAVANGTRIIAVVIKGVYPKTDPLPEALARTNLIFFETGTPGAVVDNFDEGLRELNIALDTDFDYWYRSGELAEKARQWRESGHNRSYLLSGKALETAQQWQVLGASRKPSPSPDQVQFIDASRRTTATRRRTIITSVISGLGLVAIIFAGLAGIAYHNSRVALSRQLAGESNTARLNNRPDLAILLGLEATRTDSNADSRNSLAAALAENSHLETILPIGKPSPAIYVTHFAYDAAGTEVVAGASDGSLIAWDVATRHRTDLSPPKSGQAAYIQALAVSPDGKSVAYVDGDGLWLWRNTLSRAPTVKLSPLDYYHTTLALSFNSDGTKLVSVTAVCASHPCVPAIHIQMWNVADTSKVPTEFDLPSGTKPIQQFDDFAALSADATTLVVSCNDACSTRQLQQWDLTTLREVTTRDADPSGTIAAVVLSRDGHSVASIKCSTSHRCDETQIWNLSQQGGPVSIQTKTSMRAVAFTKDDAHLVTGECLDDPDCTSGQLQIWDVSTSSAVALTDPFGGHINRIDGVAVSPDGSHILTQHFDDNELLMWNPGEVDAISREMHSTPLDLPPATDCSTIPLVYQAVYSPDGTTIAEATADSLVLLDAASLKPLTGPIKLDPVGMGYSNAGYTDDKGVYQLSFSPSGTRLAAMTQHNIYLWDLQSRILTPAGRIYDPAGGNYLYNGVSFNRDGTRLAIINNHNSAQDTSGGSAIEIWDVSNGTGKLVKQLQRDTYDVYGLALSPDGNTVAALYFPHWLACQIPNLATLTAYYDHNVAIWDVEQGKLSGDTFGEHSTAIASLAYSPDGKILASVDIYGSAILWDAANPKAKHLAKFDGFQQQQVKVFGAVSFSQDGGLLAVSSGEFLGGQPDSVAVWDVDSQQLVDLQMITTDLSHGAEIVNAQLLPDREHPGESQLAWMVGQSNQGAIYTRTRHLNTWQARACQMANQTLTQGEWDQFGGGGRAPDSCPENQPSMIVVGAISANGQPIATPTPKAQATATPAPPTPTPRPAIPTPTPTLAPLMSYTTNTPGQGCDPSARVQWSSALSQVHCGPSATITKQVTNNPGNEYGWGEQRFQIVGQSLPASYTVQVTVSAITDPSAVGCAGMLVHDSVDGSSADTVQICAGGTAAIISTQNYHEVSGISWQEAQSATYVLKATVTPTGISLVVNAGQAHTAQAFVSTTSYVGLAVFWQHTGASANFTAFQYSAA